MNLKDFFKKYKQQSKKGFTLIELIAVVCILAITSTAIVSVFLMVRNTVSDTGEITADQYTSGQMEKFIRNEFQVASKVDVYDVDTGFVPSSPFSAVKNDEWMVYDASVKSVYFKKTIDDAGTIRTLLTIDNVENVHIQIYPLDSTVADPTGSKLKMVYTIESESFTYSGGIVIGNTSVNEDGNLDNWGTNQVDLTWDASNSAGQNDYLIAFHSEVPYSTSSTASP